MNPSQGGGEGATFGSQSFAEIVELPNLTQGLTSQQLSQMDPFRLLTSSQQPSQQDMFPGGLGAGFGLGAAAPLFMPSQHESSLLNAMALASADPARFAAQSAYHVSMAPGAGKPVHHSLLKDEHRNSKAARRGPMDEMRQLVRIMVKLIPASSVFISEDNGGGNRVSEEQIREYLRATLGDGAPQPEWGLPRGWGQYLADLLAWATGSVVTKDQAMACARRPQGRSWEAVPEALARVNAYPHTWPLPLTFEGVRAANAGHIAGHGLGMEGVAEEEEHPAAAGGVAHPVGGGGIKREGSPDMDLPVSCLTGQQCGPVAPH